jgi:hypothetical protein
MKFSIDRTEQRSSERPGSLTKTKEASSLIPALKVPQTMKYSSVANKGSSA